MPKGPERCQRQVSGREATLGQHLLSLPCGCSHSRQGTSSTSYPVTEKDTEAKGGEVSPPAPIHRSCENIRAMLRAPVSLAPNLLPTVL